MKSKLQSDFSIFLLNMMKKEYYLLNFGKFGKMEKVFALNADHLYQYLTSVIPVVF